MESKANTKPATTTAGSNEAPKREKFVPETNIVKIKGPKRGVRGEREGRNTSPRFFMNLTKYSYLSKFESVELHSLGEATATAVRVAENLQRYEIARITNIRTEYVENNDSKVKKIKLIITLAKG
jgi:hypothetical protein